MVHADAAVRDRAQSLVERLVFSLVSSGRGATSPAQATALAETGGTAKPQEGVGPADAIRSTHAWRWVGGRTVDALVALCEQTRFHVMTSQPELLLQAALDVAFAAAPAFPRLALGFLLEGVRALSVALQQQGNKTQPVRAIARAWAATLWPC